MKPHPGYPGFGPPVPGGKDYMGVTTRLPQGAEKYYPEWNSSNTKSNQEAESERLAAERLLQETKELIAETKQKVKQDAKEVDARFRQRVGDIAFWKSELDGKLAELKDNLDDLDSQRIRVEQALEACIDPLKVSEQCLANRNQRLGADRVDDNVQKHLKLEIETLKNSQVLLRQTLLQVMEELRQMQKSKHVIDKDLVDKEAAIKIDQQSSILKVSGPDKKKGITKYPVGRGGSVFSPADWQEYSEKNLLIANGQLKSSIELQSTVDGVLAHIASHLKSQYDLAERAIDRRLVEVKEAKRLLEEQLAETIVKIGEMEDSVIALEKAISTKQGPLATCQLRIQQRKQRPNVELVLDDVDTQLHNEAQNLIESINKLEGHLILSRNCFSSLNKSKLELEAQISIKTNSIFIDEVKCKTIRHGIVIQAY